MKFNGLFMILIGIVSLLIIWEIYFNNITYLLTLNKFILYLILFIGLIFTIICGLVIGVGIKMLFDPDYIEKLKNLFKS